MSCSYHSLFLHLTFDVSFHLRRDDAATTRPFLSCPPTPILSPALSRNVEWRKRRRRHRSIVGCNVIIPRGVCGRVSNLGAADAAYICVCACVYVLSATRYIIRAVIYHVYGEPIVLRRIRAPCLRSPVIDFLERRERAARASPGNISLNLLDIIFTALTGIKYTTPDTLK